MQELDPVRGYLSTMDTKLFFGTGKSTLANSVMVTWPGQKKQVFRQLKTDTVYTVYQQDASIQKPSVQITPVALFTDVTNSSGVHYKHTDVSFFAYGSQRLLPQKISQLRPFIATGESIEMG